VFDVAANRIPIPLVGRVASKSEATVRTGVSGEISGVNYDVGDYVSAGVTIAEISNGTQRAELLRAQGVLQGAQANLLKVQTGGGENKVLVKEAVRSAFTTSDDVIRNKIDQMIADPLKARPRILNVMSDYYLRQEAEESRVDIRELMSQWESELSQLDRMDTTEALLVYVLKAQVNLEEIRKFLDLMAQVAAGFEPTQEMPQSTIDKWRNDISVSRNLINSSITNVITTYNNIRSQIDTVNGGEDLLAAQAQITQAEAGVLAAQSALEKTIIRSPISGQVNEILVDTGDFVSTFDEIATIANNNALEVTTYMGEKDRKMISVGAKVTIDGTYDGVVTSIAPALNQETGKIEVIIGVNDVTNFTNGQSVSLEIERTDARANTGTEDVMTVPIAALKITSNGNFLFTVEDGRLVAHEVQVGSILGDKIIVTDGITATMEIVLDARGLDEGQEVNVR
jgi:RND family efflux transporter MFP subunit